MGTTTEHGPSGLSATEVADGWALALDGEAVTALFADQPVVHRGKPLIDQMVAEFMGYQSIATDDDGRIVIPKDPTSYFLWSFQRRWIDTGLDNVTADFGAELLRDPLWSRLPGPEALDQLARTGPVREWLGGLGVEWFDVCDVAVGDWVGMYAEFDPDTGEVGEVTAKANESYRHAAEMLCGQFLLLTPEERAAVVFLHNVQQGALTHALALVDGACTPTEFAVGVLGAQGVFPAMPDVGKKRLAKSIAGLSEVAATALAYIAAYREPTGAH